MGSIGKDCMAGLRRDLWPVTRFVLATGALERLSNIPSKENARKNKCFWRAMAREWHVPNRPWRWNFWPLTRLLVVGAVLFLQTQP